MGERFDTIRTARLLMRRWREVDRDPYAAMNADPVVMMYFPAAIQRAASDVSIDRMEALFERQGFGLWALELAETGEFLGFTGLNRCPRMSPARAAWKSAGGLSSVPGTKDMPPKPPPPPWTWPSTAPAITNSGR